MPTFRGQRQFRQQGQSSGSSRNEWTKTASSAISQGATVHRDNTGAEHLVSPSGAHWGTFNGTSGTYQGGTLNKFNPDDSSEDVTSSYSQNEK
jgi:hypothetical protein